MLDADPRLTGDRTRSLKLHLDIGTKVDHELERLLLDEPADVGGGQRLEVVRAQQHAGNDDPGVDGALERDPADGVH